MEFQNLVKSDLWLKVRLGMPTGMIRDGDKMENDHFGNADSGGEGQRELTNATESHNPDSGSPTSKDDKDQALCNALEWPLHLGLPYAIFGVWGLLIDPMIFPAFQLPAHLGMGYAAATAVAFIQDYNRPPKDPQNGNSVELFARERRQSGNVARLSGTGLALPGANLAAVRLDDSPMRVQVQ